MAVAIRILKSQADELANICSIGAEGLDRVASAIGTAPLTIKRERLREIIASLIPEEAAAKLCTVIFGLSAVASRDAKKMAETVEGLSITLRSDFKDDARFAGWPEVSAALMRILLCESVYLAAKAVDISYDFERIFTECRIITSIRPVYNDARDHIVGNTIVQTLRLEFMTASGGKESTSIALDLSDISKLLKTCEDAQEKAEVARTELESRWQKEIIMIGEGANS